ncbi:MAG: hypothetical protein NXI18_01755, partial [Alphaproteobacteria bacterium]|nr:hypothetical protein [Alphaproteobacteria bacterium]
IPATGPGDDHPAKLAVRLRSATPVAQLGAETAYALTFNPDQSAGAGQSLFGKGGIGPPQPRFTPLKQSLSGFFVVQTPTAISPFAPTVRHACRYVDGNGCTSMEIDRIGVAG